MIPPATSTVTLQTTITGEGRNDVVNLVPTGLPPLVNQVTNPITCPNFAIFKQYTIAGSGGVLTLNFPVTRTNIRYVIVQRAGGTALAVRWTANAEDTGIVLNSSGAALPLIWALPFVNPPSSCQFTNQGAAGALDVWYLG